MIRNSRWFILAAIIVLGLAVVTAAGCWKGQLSGYSDGGEGGGGTSDSGTKTGGGTSDSGTNEVIAEGLAFSPATLEVSVGDTVTWTNRDASAHTVEVDGKNLGRMAKGESLTWTAESTGTFDYLCTIHPSMTGEIVVK